MSQRAKQGSLAGLASATSAQDTARNGATLSMAQIDKGTLVAQCIGSITTASVVATYKWQVSMDGTNWDELKLPSNTASVTIAGGGGSPLAHRVALIADASVTAYSYARVNATLSGASTAGADVTAVTYRYCRI